MRRTDEHAPRTTRRGPPPMLIEALFYVFGAILVAASLAVITARNPVYSALALVMCFVTSAAMLLLVAIVAAIALTMRNRAGLKYQDVSRQVAVRREQRLRIVKMDAEKRP